MTQKRINKCSGLRTFLNQMSSEDSGGLTLANNVVVDRNNIVEPRRGYKVYSENIGGDLTDRVKQLLNFKGRLLAHVGSSLFFDDDSGNLTQFADPILELEDGLRIKSTEANGNLYITTASGIKKISEFDESDINVNSISNAGVPAALDTKVAPDYTINGFLEPDSATAYRIVWGIRDNNDNLLLGSPSNYTVVRNQDLAESCVTTIEFPIPQNITSSHFFRVYRSPQKSPFTSVPDDDMNLVYEDFPTQAQLASGVVETQDITPDDFRDSNELLYTNPSLGGIAQANQEPPISKDVTTYQNITFYGNTKTRHSLDVSMLSVDGYTPGFSKFVTSNGSVTAEYTFVGEPQSSEVDFTAYSGTVPGDLSGVYWFLNSANNTRRYFVWYDTTGSDLPPSDIELSGRLGIKVDVSAAVNEADVATATAAAIDGLDDFISSSFVAGVVSIINSVNGESDPISDSTNNPVGGGVVFSTTVSGEGEDAALQRVLLSSEASPAVRIDQTARSLTSVINRQLLSSTNAFYTSGPTDIPGLITLKSRTLDDSPFYVAVNDPNIAEKFDPILPVVKSITSSSLTNPVELTCNAHGYVSGDEVLVYGFTGNPTSVNGIHKITVVDANTFSINIDATAGVSGIASVFKTSAKSRNEVARNRVYFSKPDQPEAVPGLNFLNIGSKDRDILRIVALREAVLVFKEDAVFRLSGNSARTFTVDLLDSSAILTAPDSVAVLNNQVYMLSTQGVATFTDSSSSVISRAIENEIVRITPSKFPNFGKQSFGVAYETDRAYLLFLPTETDDTTATQCFRYNYFTRAWTRWDMSKTCGLVSMQKDLMYLGPSDINAVEIERKDRERQDYADREYQKSLIAGGLSPNLVTLNINSVSDIKVGDVLYQKQTITLKRFNRLLKKLDIDPALSDADYESSLTLYPGGDLTQAVDQLITKLNLDDTTKVYSWSSPTNPDQIKVEFNELIEELNTSEGIYFSDYTPYESSVEFESDIVSINPSLNTITVRLTLPWLFGDFIVFEGYSKSIQWSPEFLGDPSQQKQIREATLMFENYNFRSGKMGFSTDASNDVELVEFQADGSGAYGFQSYGMKVYGGGGGQRPFRTYVPRNKQRCRFIKIRFEHDNAREGFSLEGYSVTHNSNESPRAYRG